jgi:hypothetical protein
LEAKIFLVYGVDLGYSNNAIITRSIIGFVFYIARLFAFPVIVR